MQERIAMNNLFGITKEGCLEVMKKLGEPSFRGNQLYQWLYEKKVTNFDACTNFSKALREKMKADYDIEHGAIIKIQSDPEDQTHKYLIRLQDGECIETVLMAYHHGYSLCVSSQVGCAMGCAFCASTRGGLVRNLTAGEILDQIYLVEDERQVRVSNVVIMGIGEPLANYRAVMDFIALANSGWGIGMRKITLSTCGLVPEIDRLAEEDLQINLAISLHSPFQSVREQIMPIAKRYDIQELLKSCKKYFTKTSRRLTFEYALIAGVNDRPEDVRELTRLFKGLPVHINLIALNPVTESHLKGSKNVNFFSDELKRNGINCTIRRKMGNNIDAACGQLRQQTKIH
ncbi:MAG: 23S rRNA (adenine(2503)-C(2))-methyltransferase RlmN [Eubacteriaceae bacterium]|nr:23S rRNA (adenine(2503)-C(2))-methyltransferase RlmN [Eubacteriaceae bacterium]